MTRGCSFLTIASATAHPLVLDMLAVKINLIILKCSVQLEVCVSISQNPFELTTRYPMGSMRNMFFWGDGREDFLVFAPVNSTDWCVCVCDH